MIVDVSTELPCAAEVIFDHIRSPKGLKYAASPIVSFTSVEEQIDPARWEEKNYQYSVHLFGYIPLGIHTMSFSYTVSPDKWAARDNGYSQLCKTWDHLMTVKTIEGGVLYTDRAEIKAGALTPVIWVFAQILYRHRQRRWRKLANKLFQY